MSKVTVSQAARLTGKSRETINTACNDGKISSSKNEQGIRVIDISELARVYPLTRTMETINQSEPVKPSQVLTPDEPSDIRELVAVLKAQLQGVTNERDLIKAQQEQERDQWKDRVENLQTALAKAQEQGNRAMLLLTDQSEGSREKTQEQEQMVRLLSESVERLKGQNKRIYRELQEQKRREQERGFWRWPTGRGKAAAERHPVPERAAQKLA